MALQQCKAESETWQGHLSAIETRGNDRSVRDKDFWQHQSITTRSVSDVAKPLQVLERMMP